MLTGINWFNVPSHVHIHDSIFNWISIDVQPIPIPIAIPNPLMKLVNKKNAVVLCILQQLIKHLFRFGRTVATKHAQLHKNVSLFCLDSASNPLNLE